MFKEAFSLKRIPWRHWLLITSGLLFLLDWYLVASQNSAVLAFDHHIRWLVNTHRTPAQTAFFTHFTRLFDPWPAVGWAGLFVLWLSWHRQWRWTAQFSLALCSGTLLNKVIKHLVNRPRPNAEVLMHYGGFSFPSGHSSGAALLLGGILLVLLASPLSRRTKGWGSFCLGGLIILVGCSRIYVGAHFPSDVLGGWCLGIFVLSLWQIVFTHFLPHPTAL